MPHLYFLTCTVDAPFKEFILFISRFISSPRILYCNFTFKQISSHFNILPDTSYGYYLLGDQTKKMHHYRFHKSFFWANYYSLINY